MKAVVIEKAGVVQIKNVDIPELKPDEVRIRVEASGICGTDVHIFHGDYLGSYPIIPGHEFSGVVDKVGSSVTRIKVGMRVAVEPNIACDNCTACLNNRQNFCENWSAVGVTRSGGMAEFAVAPEKAVFPIGELDFNSGAFVEPLSCVVHGVSKVNTAPGDRVLILGAGPIGILLSKVLQLRGVSSIVQIDKNVNRLNIAQQSGAQLIASSVEDTDKESFDLVVDATGVPSVMAQTLDFVRKGGSILLFGVPPQESILSLPAFTLFEKGVNITTSFTSVRNSIQSISMLDSGILNVKPLVSHQLPLEQFRKGIELMENGTDGVMKVLIKPQLSTV